MITEFEIRDIETTPKDTGVNQFIQMLVEIIQFFSEDIYSKATDTEIYSGEGVGLL